MANTNATSNGVNIPLDQQNIINILGIATLPDERKAALIDQASELVQKRLLVRILDGLNPKQREEFGALLDQNNQAGVQEFLTANVPNLPQMLVEETNQLKQEFADLTATIE